MSSKLLFAVAGILAVALFASIACGDDEPSEAEAEQEFCDDVAQLASAVQSYRALTITSSVDDAQSAASDVESALQAVESSAQDVSEARTDQVTSAVDSLKSSVDDLPSGTTIADAFETLQPQIAALEASIDELGNSANCALTDVEATATEES